MREQDLDLTVWLEYFVHGLVTQLNEVKQRGETVIRRDVIARENGLNERQSALIEILLERGEVGIQDFVERVPGVHRRTLQRDLAGLVDAGIITVQGGSRSARYKLKGRKL